jgi:cobalamin-dependent methionine synthase I
MLDSWILDNLGTYAVGKATDYLQRIVEDETGCRLSRFNPGSTPSWSIEQQQVLFGILSRERVRETIGVELGESCIMTPKKSVSGIMAATVREFHNCQACKRECEYRQFSFEGS